jgi:DNA-binding SARP family transcriptional activator
VLGDLEVVRDGVALPLGGPKPRTIVGILVAARGRPVGTERLIDQLWGDDSPPKGRIPVMMIVTSRRIAALEGRPPSAVRACRQ